MHILLVASSGTQKTLEKVVGLSKASILRGHDVTIFFNSNSVLLLRPDTEHRSLHCLVSKGIKLLACRTSALDHGIFSQNALLDGSNMSSMSELMSLLEVCDKALFIG